jgi:hypothetical protein
VCYNITIQIDMFFLCTARQKLGFGLESSKIHCDSLCFSKLSLQLDWFTLDDSQQPFFVGERGGGDRPPVINAFHW